MATSVVDPAPVRSDPMTVSGTALRAEDLEPYRRELTGYCYRMLGSGPDAEDAVQETMLRAWRAADQFEGRASVRSWLFRIATNVCFDQHRGSQRRIQPMDLGPASAPDESHLGPLRPELPWVSPVADDRVLPTNADPADVAAGRESIRLAFITALQQLPAKQRAALILCEVLKWRATEVAELLDTSVPAVNSALQRARASLASVSAEAPAPPLDPDQAELLARYLDAFERYDIDRLVTLLHDDAVMSMPPFGMWLQGAADIGHWMVQPGPMACKGSRLIRTHANGCPAFGQYKIDPAGGHAPWALQVVEISGGRIVEFHFFLDTGPLFPLFGLPAHLPADLPA
jgi:RNA polymerase sigma-70 factor (ECF subfamily)